MQNSANEVIETIKTLPIREKAKIYEWLDEEKRELMRKPLSRENAKEQFELFRKAQEWVLKNREKYLNQWVCLDGDKLIAHGTDAPEVHRQAKESGIEIPYLEQIVEEEDWGGW
ncbi:MAG TPA: DUF5678 domain-containing protein [Pyrinomonadaceae bacterium]|nr:DUF5678 domain-containing protein [Pyrinomonadaceae bacterium]